MLKDKWKTAVVNAKIMRTVFGRSVAMLRDTYRVHSRDVRQRTNYLESELHAVLYDLGRLSILNSRYEPESPSKDQSEYASSITFYLRKIARRIDSIADQNERLAVDIQVEASPVLAKANDILLFMKRKDLTPHASPYPFNNEKTHDRQQTLANGNQLRPTDRMDVVAIDTLGGSHLLRRARQTDQNIPGYDR